MTHSPARRTFLQCIVDRNPFYLISPVLMLLGCSLLSRPQGERTADIGTVLLLLATINFYEVLVIGLALYLFTRRGLRRDARILLTAEAMFLVDVTFLSGEISTAGLGLSLLVNTALLALGAIKAGVVLRVLRIPQARPILAFIIAQIGTLLFVPTFFKLISEGARDGQLPALSVYTTWWVAGAIPVAAAWAWRRFGAQPAPAGTEMGLARIFAIVPFASLLAHLYEAGWVYKVPFYGANLTPILLGAAILVAAARNRLIPAVLVPRVQTALMLLGLALSLSFPRELAFAFGGSPVTPLRLALVAIAGITAATMWQLLRPGIVIAGAACLVAAMLGPTVGAIKANVIAGIEAAFDWGERSVPRTTSQWGIVAVVGSFVMLCAGAAVSLLTRPAAPPTADAAEDARPTEEA